MIRSFKHKGLEKFFSRGSKAGIQAAHRERLRMQLAMLNAAQVASDMNKPGWNLHPLKGKRTGTWAIKVSGNWRITFTLENGDAHLIDYEDYH